jgi:hypothetical protein
VYATDAADDRDSDREGGKKRESAKRREDRSWVGRTKEKKGSGEDAAREDK